VIRAERRASEAASRAHIALAAGIFTSVIGMGVYAYMLPASTDADNLQRFVAQAVRPTATLLFVESIAWFLLRQYRSLIEDYKSFYRIYLVRSNYLLAYKALRQSNGSDLDVLFATALLNEGLTGRLLRDSSASSIDANRAEDGGPMHRLLLSLANGMSTRSPT
jgi:hypothetical protein